jgi:hypothetical protein
MSDSVTDWLNSQSIDLRGRKKLLLAAGVMSRTGDAARHFRGFSRYLQREHGYSRGDFLEATYHGRGSGADWLPLAYEQTHCEAPLAESSANITRQLRWYDARLPIDQELHLLGYSLGGVLLFRAAAALVAEDRARWRARLGSVVTLASPLFGTDLGAEGDLLGLFGFNALILPGPVGHELVVLGRDPAHRARVEREADLIRGAGIQLLTLADEFDTVVTPEDAVIAPPAERDRFVLRSSRTLLGGTYADAVFGHGPLLENPQAWQLMVQVIGPQEPRLRTATGAIPL